MGNFLEFLKEQKKDCDSVNTIQDINSQYSYEDKIGGGSKKWDLLSCGQDSASGGYNELQRFYDEHIPIHFKGLAFHQTAMKILCECCTCR